MTDHKLENCVPTSTGNEMGYYDWELHSPQWQTPIGPEFLDDILWAEAIAYDAQEFPPVHIHVSESSRDCDGGHGYDYVRRPDERDMFTLESARMYAGAESMVGRLDLERFWRKAIGWAVSLSDESGTLEHTREGEYDRRASYRAPTDEGYHATDLTLCAGDCKDSREVYDQYARMAGY